GRRVYAQRQPCAVPPRGVAGPLTLEGTVSQRERDNTGMNAVHPRSVLRAAGGREVFLKVHQCIWSGRFHGNTLESIEECLAERVARAEIDVLMRPEGDWNLRRLLAIEPALRMGFDPAGYLDVEDSELPVGAYGYRDAHPLANARYASASEYLFDRMGGILRLVPSCEEIHLRLSASERMVEDEFAVADFV